MKRKFAPLKTLVLFCITMLSLAPSTLFAQPDYEFRNPVRISGTNLQVGARYRFSNVRPGIDGIIEIKGMTNGITLQTLDGKSGFDEAFQPTVSAPAGRNGYVEFQLDFVISGTMTSVRVPELPMTAIDIDGTINGNRRVFEFDQYEHGTQYRTIYEMVGSSLSVQEQSGWTTVKNTTGVEYPGIDTVQRDVMFTAIYSDVSRVLFRVGTDNQSTGNMNRLRSIYFKKFNYASGLLPVGSLVHFGGFTDPAGVQLNWELAAGCKPGTITIERSVDAVKFVAVTQRIVQSSIYAQKDQYLDRVNLDGAAFYRLKLQTTSGETEYTRILSIRSQGNAGGQMKIYPTIVDHNAMLNFHAAERTNAVVAFVDLNGRTMNQQKILAGEGANVVQLDGLDRMPPGAYLVTLTVGNDRMTQRIIKR